MGDNDGCAFCSLTVLVALIVGMAIGGCIQDRSTRKDAMKANAGHYFIDQNGDRQWSWGPKP